MTIHITINLSSTHLRGHLVRWPLLLGSLLLLLWWLLAIARVTLVFPEADLGCLKEGLHQFRLERAILL